MPRISLVSGKAFDSPSSTSILNSSIQAKLMMPYSCKIGRCSACKCKVLEGASSALSPELGLTEEEKSEGWILSCVRVAETDLLLADSGFDVGFELPQSKTLPCRISRIERLGSEIIRVYLRLPPAEDFQFIPGQYIDVIGPKGVRRSYSLANCNFDDKTLELHIRLYENGAMSRYWSSEAKVNDLLRLNGPFGTFFLRDTTGIDLVFLATGTGIAPIKAMLESIASFSTEKLPKSVTVLWGARKFQDFYLSVSDINSSFNYVPVCSRPIDSWNGESGYVQDVIVKLLPNLKIPANWEGVMVYACGSNEMIQGAYNLLTKAGLRNGCFHSDSFVCTSNNNK